MSRSRPGRALLLAGLLAGAGTGAAAHPLDEYVQASYLTLGPEGVTIDLRLTPGVEVATRVLAVIDTDRDRAISDAEGRAYAAMVLRELSLELDGRGAPLRLAGAELPAVADLLRGEGTIALRVESDAPGAGRPGDHRLAYRNGHEPARSAYLVNSYVPAAPFSISAQTRDYYQRGIEVDYTVARGRAGWHWWGGAALVALAGGLGVASARRRRARGARGLADPPRGGVSSGTSASPR